MKRITLSIVTLLLISILLTLSWALMGGAEGIGRRLAELQRPHPQTTTDPVVASVNGQPITLHTVEVSAQTLRLTAPELDEQQAFKIALAKTVLNTALYQKARQAGITVSREEAEAIYKKTRELAQQNPVTKEYFETLDNLPPEQRKAIEETMIEGYRQALAVARWREQQVQQAVPRPTQEEVEAYLKEHPNEFRNHLVLSTILFKDGTTANRVYTTLKKAQARGNTDVTTLFRQAAHEYNPDRKEFTETFTFLDPDDLPDYARDALRQEPGTLRLFRRSDGTYVLYRVEHVIFVPKERIYEQVAERLWQQRKQTFVDKLFKQVLREANIRIYEENLPEGVHVTQEDILQQLESPFNPGMLSQPTK